MGSGEAWHDWQISSKLSICRPVEKILVSPVFQAAKHSIKHASGIWSCTCLHSRSCSGSILHMIGLPRKYMILAKRRSVLEDLEKRKLTFKHFLANRSSHLGITVCF